MIYEDGTMDVRVNDVLERRAIVPKTKPVGYALCKSVPVTLDNERIHYDESSDIPHIFPR